MKRGWTIGLVSLLSLNFVSALGFGGLGNFGFGSLFSSFNIELYLDALIFITIFAVIHFSLERSIFRENRAVSFVVSLCVSSFAMYGLLSTGFSVQEILYSLGLTQDILPTLLWMIAITILIFLLIKFGIRNTIAILFGLLGTFLIAYSLIADFYNQGAAIAIGIISLIIALFIHKKTTSSMMKGIGKGAGTIGNFGLKRAKWVRSNFSNFLKQEKKIIRKIKKLEKKYQRAMNNNKMKEAKDYSDQIKYLETRLQRVKSNEVQAEREGARQEKKAVNSIYSSGMRRGGKKGTRGRFVSKASVERYARRYGEDAARKRFGD